MKKEAIAKCIVVIFGIIAISLICIAFFFYEFDAVVDLGIYKLFSKGISVVLAEKYYMALVILLSGLFVILFMIRILNRVSISFTRNGKDISGIIVGLMVLLELLVILVCANRIQSYSDIYQVENGVAQVRVMVQKEKTVIHAAGNLELNGASYTYTNSYEALENCYTQGNRISEIDFLETTDGKLVCCHDDENGWAYGISSDEPLSEAAFLNSKLFGNLTTMGMDQLAAFMRDHTDMYIVTDIKDDNYKACKYIADNYPDIIDRVIVQIYHMDEYDGIKSLGFNYMIYTLYRTESEERESLVEDIKGHDLVGVTFWYEWLDTKDVYDNIKDIGVPIFVHTVNNKDDIMNCDSMSLLIYTDNTDNEWLR